MSYVMGNDPREIWVVLAGATALVVSLASLSRRQDNDPGRVVCRCADGSRIGEWGTGVRRRPGRTRTLLRRLVPWRAGVRSRLSQDLEPGDLSDLRIREGRAGEAEWVVEGLDRGAEPYALHWEFVSADEALAAFRLLDRRIARPPLDAEGRPVWISDRDFEARWAGGSQEPGAAAGGLAAKSS